MVATMTFLLLDFDWCYHHPDRAGFPCFGLPPGSISLGELVSQRKSIYGTLARHIAFYGVIHHADVVGFYR